MASHGGMFALLGSLSGNPRYYDRFYSVIWALDVVDRPNRWSCFTDLVEFVSFMMLRSLDFAA